MSYPWFSSVSETLLGLMCGDLTRRDLDGGLFCFGRTALDYLARLAELKAMFVDSVGPDAYRRWLAAREDMVFALGKATGNGRLIWRQPNHPLCGTVAFCLDEINGLLVARRLAPLPVRVAGEDPHGRVTRSLLWNLLMESRQGIRVVN